MKNIIASLIEEYDIQSAENIKEALKKYKLLLKKIPFYKVYLTYN